MTLTGIGRMSAGTFDEVATQMDVMPTTAGLAGIPALNTTLGRNLLDPRFSTGGAAFIYRTRGVVGEIGIFDGAWVLLVGASPFALRVPSLVAGVAVVPLVYWLGARLLSRSCGIVAALLVAINLILIEDSREDVVSKAQAFEEFQLQSLLRSVLPDPE